MALSDSSDSSAEQSANHAMRKHLEDTIARLMLESKLLISELGGIWPEQPDQAHFRRVLDSGCGTGYWLVHAAKTYPTIEQLYGVDRDPRLIAHARLLAREEGVDNRVEFHAMDALSILEFPFDYLDLVSIQMGGCFLRTWEWVKLLQEFQRVTRRGGVLRVVEQDFFGESTSPAFNRLMQMLAQTYYRAGHFFTPDRDGLLREMPRLFDQYGVRDVQTRFYTVQLRADTPDWPHYAKYIILAITPFIAKWGRLPEDYHELRQQALTEMAHPDFVAQWRLLVVWGTK